MKRSLTAIFLAFFLLLIVSCSEEVKAPDDSWESIFLQYWNAMNTEFVHFSEDTSYDWDRMYEEYLAKFRALDYTKKDDSLKAFAYFKEISLNAPDNHYNLIVKDGFGQSLSANPGILRKYAAKGGNIMDFPDIKVVNDHGVSYSTSINDDGTVYDRSDRLKYYKAAVETFTEVSDLQEIIDEDTKTVTKPGYFHSPDGDDSVEFPDGAYCGCTFKTIDSDDLAELDTDDKTTAQLWNSLMEKLELSSYFFGVNKDDIFYVYFSDFGNPLFLYGFLTKDESEMTDTEKLALQTNSVKELRTAIEVIESRISSISNKDLKEIINTGITGLKNLPELLTSLDSVISKDECTINGTKKEKFKGIIVDVRGNGGGKVSFLLTFWGLFFESETKFGYERYKAGYSRLEYTPWTSFSIPRDYVNSDGLKGKGAYSRPVALIVNEMSVSCSELSCAISKLLPDSTIVGHTTFGGTGCLSDRKVSNSGPFQSEHLYIYTTTFQFVDNDMKSYETKGFEPDIKSEIVENRDDAYIKAVDWVKTNTK